MHDGNMVLVGKPLHGPDVLLADFAEGGRGGNRELALPAQEDTDLPHRLQLRHVGLQEDAVDGTALAGHVVSQ